MAKIQFYAQLAITSTVLAFCLAKLWLIGESANSSTYWSVVSALIGYWLPSPAQSAKPTIAIEQNDELTTNIRP